MRRCCLLMLGLVLAVSACDDDQELVGAPDAAAPVDASGAGREARPAASDAADAASDRPEVQPDGPPAVETGDTGARHLADGEASGAVAAGTQASFPVTVAEGGLGQLGDASLLVPADTVPSDRVIELAVREPPDHLANRADVIGKLYVVGPETGFVTPAVLRLPLMGSAPVDKKPVIAWWDQAANQWVPVSSHVEAGQVVGLVFRLGTFAVLAVDKTDTCPFTGPCDGTPEGNWRYSSSCARPTGPFVQACGPGLTVPLHQSIGVSGSFTLGNGRFMASQTLTVKAAVFYTPACLAALDQAQAGASCAVVEANLRKQPGGAWTCRGKPTQGCSCAATNMLPREEAGTVVVAGQKLTFTRDGEEMPNATAQVCARGDVMTFKDSDGAVYSLVKQP